MIHFYNNYIPSGLKTCFFCQKLVFNAFVLAAYRFIKISYKTFPIKMFSGAAKLTQCNPSIKINFHPQMLNLPGN